MNKLWISRIVLFLAICIITIPFFTRLQDFQKDEITTARVADSFRYVWSKPGIDKYFFQSSSLSVRTLNKINNNTDKKIAVTQLVFTYLGFACLFISLIKNNIGWNIFSALFIIYIYMSDSTIWYFNVITSESIFLSTYIALISILFWKNNNIIKITASLLFGSLFIFSRNAAPYISIALLCMFLLTGAYKNKINILISGLLIFLVSVSLFIIKHYDTTKEINAVDNLYSRVFTNNENIKIFRETYGMPVGPFIEVCRKGGNNVNLPCVNQEAIYTGDAVTRQYRLTQDEYGLAEWVREKGMKSWQHFLLFKNPAYTYGEFSKALETLALDVFKNENGPYDSFTVMRWIYEKLRLNTLPVMITFILFGTCAAFVSNDSLIKISVSFLVGGLASLFVGYFGDSEEIRRYTYPAIASLYIGTYIFILWLIPKICMLFTYAKMQITSRP